ncbi:MAG: hypothetical protein KIT61_10575 [Pyrinomonadaceae bacterium]|nr:hypothetical protein [Pyrinomonadaceae bacterium]
MSKLTSVVLSIGVLFALDSVGAAQKGIDTQTQKIKETTNKTTSRESDATRSFDWGKGKTQVRERLANPYRLASRRDVLVETIKQVLRDNKFVVDEASSRFSDGIIVTQPFQFAKGPVLAQSELLRYAVLQTSDTAWSRARYTLVIEVQSIDGVQNNVTVNAKVEGRSGTGLGSEWTTLQSSGLAEDEILKLIVEAVTGKSLDPDQTINN